MSAGIGGNDLAVVRGLSTQLAMYTSDVLIFDHVFAKASLHYVSGFVSHDFPHFVGVFEIDVVFADSEAINLVCFIENVVALLTVRATTENDFSAGLLDQLAQGDDIINRCSLRRGSEGESSEERKEGFAEVHGLRFGANG